MPASLWFPNPGLGRMGGVQGDLPPVASVYTALWIMAGLGVAGLFFYPGKAKSRAVAALFLFFPF